MMKETSSKSMSNLDVSTVPADSLALLGARTSSMTQLNG